MWFILHFIPDAWYKLFVHGVCGLGLFLVIISTILRWRIYQIIGILVLMAGIFFEGGYATEMMWRAKVEEVQKKISEQKLGRIDDLEKEVILRGFEECEKIGAKTFGIYAAANAYFMKERVYNKLCYIIASMFGVIVQHNDDLVRVTNHGEDYEYSIRQYILNGSVVRFDNYTVKSNYYKEDGGLQTIRTKEYVLESITKIAEMFPDYCTMYIRETTGMAELRLKDTRKPVGATLSDFF